MKRQGRISILFFLNSSVRAGVEEVVLSLVKRLDRATFEVHLVAPPELLDSFRLDLEDCAVATLGLRLVSWKQWKEIRALLRYLRRNRIQIVNSHLFYATLFAAPLARWAGVPVVIETTHGPEAWRRAWWKRTYWVDRLVDRLVTMHLAVSEANRRHLLVEKRFPARKLQVVLNGRDLSEYSSVTAAEVQQLRRRLNVDDASRVAVVVGRLEEQKGHRFLIEALPSVVDRYPNLRIVCVGDGSLRAELERMVSAKGLVRSVVFAGFVRRITPYYHLAEFAILPSLYEGLPLVAIEAGAAGRAVIASGVDGTLEVIVPGSTGLLVPLASPAELAKAICSLLSDPDRTRQMGEAARRRVERLFSIHRQLEQTSQLYQHCFTQDVGAS